MRKIKYANFYFVSYDRGNKVGELKIKSEQALLSNYKEMSWKELADARASVSTDADFKPASDWLEFDEIDNNLRVLQRKSLKKRTSENSHTADIEELKSRYKLDRLVNVTEVEFWSRGMYFLNNRIWMLPNKVSIPIQFSKCVDLPCKKIEQNGCQQ
ncbi:hypothetical protein ACFL6U_23260 [Planctomycetota bacterium]